MSYGLLFLRVVIGLVFVGLLPVPERTIAPGLLSGARRRCGLGN